MGRRKARELAFRTLFMAERSETPVLEVWEQVRADLREEDLVEASEEAYGDVLDEDGIRFAARLVAAWSDNRETVDELLTGSRLSLQAATSRAAHRIPYRSEEHTSELQSR